MTVEKPSSNNENTGDSKKPKDLEKNKLLLDLIKSRYDDELKRSTDLDSKAGNLIGYVTIITGLLVGIGSFSILDRLSFPQYAILFFFGIVFLMLSIILSLFAIKLRKWYSSPSINKLEDFMDNKERDYAEVVKQTFNILIEGAEFNSSNNEDKAQLITISWLFLVLGLGSFVVYASIFVIYSNSIESDIKITIEGNKTMFKELMKNYT